jgi:hypothetical protein
VLKYMVAGAVAAFVVSGPLQHIGVLPQTLVGDLSKQAIKSVLGMTAKDAFAGCKGDGGFGGGGWGGGRDFGSNHGNNGNHGHGNNGNNGNHGNGNNGNGKGKKHGRDD